MTKFSEEITDGMDNLIKAYSKADPEKFQIALNELVEITKKSKQIRCKCCPNVIFSSSPYCSVRCENLVDE